MQQSVKRVVMGVVVGSLGLVGAAHAAITYPTSLDLSGFETMAGLVVVAGAAIWAFRKAKRLIGA